MVCLVDVAFKVHKSSYLSMFNSRFLIILVVQPLKNCNYLNECERSFELGLFLVLVVGSQGMC